MQSPEGHIADPKTQDPLDQTASAAETPSRPLASAYPDYRAWLLGVLPLRYSSDAADDLAQDTYLRVHA